MKVAIIPARGGSKRILRKNIKNFHGKPIIAYSIDCAMSSQLFDYVVVSTDDDEIAECALRYGAQVPFMRPASLSGDYVGTIPVIAHAIEASESVFKKRVKSVCCIYATSPLLDPSYIKNAYSILISNNCIDYVFSAGQYVQPILRSFTIDANQRCKMLWPEYQNTRSQDLPKAYYDAGQFYWGPRAAFCEQRQIFTERSVPLILPANRVKDIDTLNDWTEAEYMFTEIEKRRGDD